MRTPLFWIPALLLAACPATEEPPEETNALPRVTVELNDGDPMEKGATFVVTLSDADGELCSLEIDHSFDKGLTYAPSTIFQNSAGTLAEIPCSESGEKVTMVWDLEADMGEADPDDVILRVQPFDPEEAGPPAHMMIELKGGTVTIAGTYTERKDAQGTQWEFHGLGLAHVELTADGAITTGTVVEGGDWSDPEDMIWTYLLTEPAAEDDRLDVDLGNSQVGYVAAYLPFVYSDETGPTVWEAGLPVVGAAQQMLVAYVEPVGDWTHEDWYVLSVDAFAPPETRYELLPASTPIEIALKGYSVFQGTLQLDVANAAEVSSTRRFGVMPSLDEPTIPSEYEEFVSAGFNPYVPEVIVEFHSEDLPTAHEVAEPWGSFADVRTEEAFYLYIDNNADLTVDDGDQLTHHTVRWSDSAPLYLFHLEGTMDLDSLWSWFVDDCWSGFNLVAPGDPSGSVNDSWNCYPVESPPEVGFLAY